MKFGSWFRRSHFLDAEDEDWHLATWKWLLANHGGIERFRRTPLVTATREFFPPSEAVGHDRAEHVFNCIKKIAGMSQWDCKLEPQPERPVSVVADVVALIPLEGQLPLGTFGLIGKDVVVTYDPAMVDKPGQLVATLAHELAHYLIAAKADECPGGHDMHEYATDLTVVFLGFGIFGANLAFNFSQHRDSFSQGWQTSRQGYLRERDWAFALAVFQVLKDLPSQALANLVKPHIYADIKNAERYLRRDPALVNSVLS
jgi:hypothetical protein